MIRGTQLRGHREPYNWLYIRDIQFKAAHVGGVVAGPLTTQIRGTITVPLSEEEIL